MENNAITATGLHRMALIMDLSATVNRVILHGDESEMYLLTRDQLTIYLASTGVDPTHPTTAFIRDILKQKDAK